jgi:hypothetical protein
VGRIAVAIDLDAPPDVVWRIVEPIERHVEWMADAVVIRFETDQTRGVGTRFLCATRFGPLRLTDRMTITEWAPRVAMGVSHSGVVTGTGQFTLTPLSDERTRFAWEEELHFPWWLGGRLGEAVGGQLVVKAVWRRNLRRLARLVATERARGR